MASVNWWEAVVLGVVQGLTEFLPISSSAHIRVVGALLPHGSDPGAAFTAVTQIGTGAAVLWYFRRDIAQILVAWFRALAGRDGPDWSSRFGSKSADARLGWWVILGSIPIVVLGLLFQQSIESSLRNLWITAGVLAAFALVLEWADRIGAKHRELGSLRARDAVVLGLAQAAALVPGVSRSGGTISAGLLLGLSRVAAARFSFLLALPAIVGSGFYELAKNKDELTAVGGAGLANTAIAAIVSAVVGYVVIVWFLRLLTTRSFTPFVVYRWIFAVAIVVLIVTNTIPVR